MESGFIYVLSNPSQPHLYKIGFTRESSVEKRIRAYQTGSSTPFVIEYSLFTSNPYQKEQIIHKFLEKYRCTYGGGREWFERVSLETIIGLISEVERIYSILHPNNTYPSAMILE